MPPENETYAYRVDATGILTDVSPNWDAFALANDGSHLVAKYVVGRPLLDFITDDTTRLIYALVFERLSSRTEPLKFPFRCDSPDKRRSMEMTLQPLPEGGLRLESRVLYVERRPPVAVLDARAERGDGLLRMCSWCKRVEVAREWVELERYVADSGVMSAPKPPRVTHGMCPSCSAEVLGQIERLGSP